MVDRTRLVNGVPTSLRDLGYNDVGLDDAWYVHTSDVLVLHIFLMSPSGV